MAQSASSLNQIIEYINGDTMGSYGTRPTPIPPSCSSEFAEGFDIHAPLIEKFREQSARLGCRMPDFLAIEIARSEDLQARIEYALKETRATLDRIDNQLNQQTN